MSRTQSSLQPSGAKQFSKINAAVFTSDGSGPKLGSGSAFFGRLGLDILKRAQARSRLGLDSLRRAQNIGTFIE